MLKPRTAVLASIAIGVALEVGVILASGRREAWDSPVYWTVGVPSAFLGAAAIGYLAAGTAWRAALLIVPAQVAAMMYRTGEPGNLWPLTVALSFVMGLPFLLVSYLASRRRKSRRA